MVLKLSMVELFILIVSFICFRYVEMTRLKGPPDSRKNYNNLNEGQKRYAWEQYKLALVRRGLDIDHPVPERQPVQAETANDFDIDEVINQPVNDNIQQEIDNLTNSMAAVRGHTPAPSTSAAGQKRPAPETAEADSSKKNKGTVLPGTGQGQGDSSGPSTGSSTQPVVSEVPQSLTMGNKIHFKKVHRFLTFGFGTKPVLGEAATNYRRVFMVTSMALVPWDRLYFYLNPSEFALLPDGSKVTHCSVRVNCENIRVAFPTNSTATNLATLNQYKGILTAVGLAQTSTGLDMRPTGFADGQPMIVNALSDSLSLATDVENWYGVSNNVITGEDNFLTNTPRHQFGVPWALRHYFTIVANAAVPTKTVPVTGWPEVQKYIKEVEADSVSGTNIIHMSYKPQSGYIKKPPTGRWLGHGIAPEATHVSTRVFKGAGTNLPRTSVITTNGLGEIVKEVDQFDDWASANKTGTAKYTMTQKIEKSQIMQPGIGHSIHPQTQPSLHIGCKPTLALTSNAITGNSNNYFTDTQAYFEVIAECEIELGYPTMRALETVPNVMPHDVQLVNSGSNLAVTLSDFTFQGLYTHTGV